MGRSAALGVLLAVAVVGGTGCSSTVDTGFGVRAGSLGAPCYPNDTCNAGLSCLANVCVAEGDASFNGGKTGGGGTGAAGSGATGTTGGAAHATSSGGAPSGGTSSPGSGGAPPISGGNTGSGGAGGANGGAGGLTLGTGGSGPKGTGGAPACTGQGPSIDMYLMLDQSSSLGDPGPSGSGTWWAALQSAVVGFVNNAQSSGLKVGIQYFPLGGVAPASCTAGYSTPEVELGLLPANAAALTTSVQAHQPTAFTPTAPALQGAIDHMKAWAPANPTRVPIVVFVTDGFPTECEPQQIPDVAAIARAGFETAPKVRTFVVGLNLGTAGQNLNAIAVAGGTNAALLIDKGDVSAAFMSAMMTIRSSLCAPQAGAATDG